MAANKQSNFHATYRRVTLLRMADVQPAKASIMAQAGCKTAARTASAKAQAASRVARRRLHEQHPRVIVRSIQPAGNAPLAEQAMCLTCW